MRNALFAPVAAVGVVRSSTIMARAAALLLFLLVPSEVLGQTTKSTRAPQILQHDGKRFAAYVDEKSETATWIIDTDSLDFSLRNARSFSSKESVSAAADAFLDAHVGVFGIDRKQLSEPRVETNGTFWFISYAQVYEGLRVLGSQVGVTITYSGRIVAAGARAFPKLDVQVGAQISRAAAIASALGQTTIPQTEAVVKQDLVIVPEEMAERYVFRLAWMVILENWDNDPPFSKTFLVDAHTGTIIAEYSNILEGSSHGQGRVRLAVDESARTEPAHAASSSSITATAIPYAPPRADIPEENIFKAAPPKPERRKAAPSGAGSLSGTVMLNYYESPDSTHHPFTRREGQVFPYAKVIVQNDATQETHEVYANAAGVYEVTGLADTTHTVTFEIANDKAYIFEGLSTCEKEKSFSVEINGNTTLDHNWGWGDGGTGSATAFALNGVYHVREMYDYFRNTTTYNYDGVDGHTYRLTISETENRAYYTGTLSPNEKKIFLGRVNAMSNEIVFHEFTHDVWETLYQSFRDSLILLDYENIYLPTVLHPDFQAMNEGFANYFAADKTNDFTFAGPDDGNTDPLQFVRDLGTSDVQFLWNNCTMDGIHCDLNDTHGRGEIIAGAIWKIREDEDKRTNSQASQLLFTALQIKPQPATFEQLRDRYVAADRYNVFTNYATTIEKRFVERKIGGPVMPGIPSITVDSLTRNPEITWRDNSSLEDGYGIERRYNDGAWSLIADLDDDTEAYIDTSYQCTPKASVTNTYSYRIVPYETFPTGIESVATTSATIALSLGNCEMVPGTTATRIADASAEVEMMNDARIQVQERKVPTGLEAPHPNPFNPVTTIRYGLAEEGPVRLTVYDVLGRRVAVLLDGVQTPGKHTVRFEASHLSSGLYFIILDAGAETFTKSVLLMK